MINVDVLASKVFGILKGNRYSLKMFTFDGEETLDPTEVRRFYVVDPMMMVTINDEDGELVVSLSKAIELKDVEKLSSHLKRLANEFLLNYTIRKFSKTIQPRDFSYQAKIEKGKDMPKDTVKESLSKMFGSKLTSYQKLDEVKIHVKHSKPVSEETRGARSRNIKAIFLERAGERFRFPHNHMLSARAMARHMSYGGNFNDTVGSYILESAEDYIKLREFMTYAKRNRLINEDTSDTVETICESLGSIQQTLYRLSGAKSYHIIAERIGTQLDVAELTESGDDLADIKDKFTVKRFDEKFDEVLPRVSRIIKERESYLTRIEESSMIPILVSGKIRSFESVIEFSSPAHAFSFKLGQLAESILDNQSLSEYVTKVSRKISEGTELNAFEINVVKNVLENIVSESSSSPQKRKPISELKESKLFESRVNGSIKLFI